MIQGGEMSSGYTIVETMIFLAVSSLLFISALGLISGRQQSVQFSQGVRDAQSKLQDIINQVSSGYYPSVDNISCTAPAAGGAPVIDAGTDKQGTSSSCVFLGKVVQFGAGDEGDEYKVYSVASRRLNATDDDVSTLAEAKPTAIAPTNAADDTPNATENSVFQYGIKVTRVTIPDPSSGGYVGGSSNIGAVAFFGSFPGKNVQGSLVSGAQRVSYGAVPGSALGADSYTTVGLINTMTSAAGAGHAELSPSTTLGKGIVICLSNQGGTRKAMLTVGGNVSETSVKLDIIESSPLCP